MAKAQRSEVGALLRAYRAKGTDPHTWDEVRTRLLELGIDPEKKRKRKGRGKKRNPGALASVTAKLASLHPLTRLERSAARKHLVHTLVDWYRTNEQRASRGLPPLAEPKIASLFTPAELDRAVREAAQLMRGVQTIQTWQTPAPPHGVYATRKRLTGPAEAYEPLVPPATKPVYVEEASGQVKLFNPTRHNPREKFGPHGGSVQTLLFPKDHWTVAQAKAWAKSHGYKYGKVDAGGPSAKYYRLRQMDPEKFLSTALDKGARWQTIKLTSRSTGKPLRMVRGALREGVKAFRPKKVGDAKIRKPKVLKQWKAYKSKGLLVFRRKLGGKIVRIYCDKAEDRSYKDRWWWVIGKAHCMPLKTAAQVLKSAKLFVKKGEVMRRPLPRERKPAALPTIIPVRRVANPRRNPQPTRSEVEKLSNAKLLATYKKYPRTACVLIEMAQRVMDSGIAEGWYPSDASGPEIVKLFKHLV